MEEERLRILELIESGRISVEEGARRLEALSESAETSVAADAPAAPLAPPSWLQALWHVVFWSGVALLVGGALLVGAVYAWGVASGWLIAGWLLFALGVLVVAVGWWLPRARWLYLRVRQPHGPNIFLALPLPLGLVAWALRFARPFVPQLRETGADEVVLAMAEELGAGRPFVVDVAEGEDGEQVQIYLG